MTATTLALGGPRAELNPLWRRGYRLGARGYEALRVLAYGALGAFAGWASGTMA